MEPAGRAESLSPGELDRVASDFGVNRDELLSLAGHDDGRQQLLERRLALLHLDPEEIRLLSPLLLHDLRRTCAMCHVRGLCASEIDDPLAVGWESYCPNAGTLSTLV